MSTRRKAALGVMLLAMAWFWLCLPKPLFRSPVSYVLNDHRGRLLGASIARDGQWRFPVGDSVPAKFRACIVAFEDGRFAEHAGVDLLAFGRALRDNARAGRITSGGSTLTMQVVRLATRHRRTPRRTP